MGFSDSSLVRKVVLILLTLCFVISLIGFAIPFWNSLNGAGIKAYTGLWDACVDSSSGKVCVSITDNGLTGWFRAVRAFSILSWLLFLAALVLVVIFIFKSGKKILYLLAVCLNLAGAFCALIAFAVYAGNTSGQIPKYSASFALTIISFILGLIIGCLGIVDYLGVIGVK